MIGISTILIIYVGGIESYKNNISTGNIAEFIIYVNMLAWPVASIGWVTQLFNEPLLHKKELIIFYKLMRKLKTIVCVQKINGKIYLKMCALNTKTPTFKHLKI